MGLKRMNNTIIDSHVHVWDLNQFDYQWMPDDPDCILCRPYLPKDLKPHLDTCGIDKAIVVQADVSMDESRWLIALANQYDFIAGVVAWVDLHSDALSDQLDELMQSGPLVGVRHPVHDEPEDDWLLHDKTIAGLQVLAKKGIPYDLLIRPQHLQHAVKLKARVPDLRMVIDHLAKPLIATGGMQPWAEDLAAVAGLPGTYCKLSGMVTEADFAVWPDTLEPEARVRHIANIIKPYVDAVCQRFGMNRVMWGSDWPVCKLAASYAEVYQALLASFGAISKEEKSALMGFNAATFYNIAS